MVEGATQGPDDKETKLRNDLDRLAREAEEQSAQKHNLEVDVKRASEPYKVLSRQLKETRKDISSAERSLAGAKQQLESKRAEILERAGSAESEAAARTKQLQDAEARLVNAKEDRDRIRQAVSDSRKVYDELEPQVEQARNEVSAGNRRLVGLKTRIRELESSGNSSINIFGQRCGAVHAMVTTCDLLRSFPVGYSLEANSTISSSGTKNTFSRHCAWPYRNVCQDCSWERNV